MQLDVTLDKETQACVRVTWTPETPATRDGPGTPAWVEVIDAWFGSDGRDAMAIFNAFGIDILSQYESVIEAAIKADLDERAATFMPRTHWAPDAETIEEAMQPAHQLEDSPFETLQLGMDCGGMR